MTTAGIYGDSIKIDPRIEMVPHCIIEHQDPNLSYDLLNFYESSFFAVRVILMIQASLTEFLQSFPSPSILSYSSLKISFYKIAY